MKKEVLIFLFSVLFSSTQAQKKIEPASHEWMEPYSHPDVFTPSWIFNPEDFEISRDYGAIFRKSSCWLSLNGLYSQLMSSSGIWAGLTLYGSSGYRITLSFIRSGRFNRPGEEIKLEGLYRLDSQNGLLYVHWGADDKTGRIQETAYKITYYRKIPFLKDGHFDEMLNLQACPSDSEPPAIMEGIFVRNRPLHPFLPAR